MTGYKIYRSPIGEENWTRFGEPFPNESCGDILCETGPLTADEVGTFKFHVTAYIEYGASNSDESGPSNEVEMKTQQASVIALGLGFAN